MRYRVSGRRYVPDPVVVLEGVHGVPRLMQASHGNVVLHFTLRLLQFEHGRLGIRSLTEDPCVSTLLDVGCVGGLLSVATRELPPETALTTPVIFGGAA